MAKRGSPPSNARLRSLSHNRPAEEVPDASANSWVSVATEHQHGADPGTPESPASITSECDSRAQRAIRALRTSALASTDLGAQAAAGHAAQPGEFAAAKARILVGIRPRVVAVVAVVIALFLAFGVWLNMREPEFSVAAVPERSVTTSVVPSASGTASGNADETVVVHVAGAVNKPGVVTVSSRARVVDAVRAAGGATERADLSTVNLARAVVDGEQILVLAHGQSPPVGTAPPGSDAGLINLNSSSASQLEQLPGVGPVLAERIVAWREENGQFSSVDQLLEVSGIGEKVLEKMRDKACV